MTEPTDALLPCPFCGEAAKHSFNSLYGDMSMASCKSCGATAYAPKWNRRAVLAKWGQPAQAGAVPLDEARRMFDAGWKAAALFCDREDVVADGIIGFGASPQFEAAFSAAHGIKGGQHGTDT